MGVAHASRSAALMTLLAHYMTGEITPSSWRQMMTLLDTTSVDAQERNALASFLDDAVQEFGATDLKIPVVQEADELIRSIRVS